MNCKETTKYLDTYVDKELGADLMVEIEIHIEECKLCNAVELIKRKLKNELKTLGEVKAPDTLRNQTLDMIDVRRKRRLAMVIAIGLLAAAAVILMVLVLPQSAPPGDSFAEIVEDVVSHHSNNLPMEVKGPDLRKAVSWFRGKVNFPVHVPTTSRSRFRLEGARLSNVRAHQAARMNYNVDNFPVTVMIFDSHNIGISDGRRVKIASRNVFLGRRDGYNVAIFLDNDIAYAISSDLPEELLLEFVQDFDIR